MKSTLFQLIASGVVLGLMSGSVAIHALHVSGAKELGESQEWLSRGAGTTGSIGFGNPLRGHSGSDADTAERATLRALEEIVDRLQELKTENNNLQEQNSALQEQLKETNRDLVELQFRVDSHSQEFRPMPVSPTMLLEGSITPGSSMHPLLPPKQP